MRRALPEQLAPERADVFMPLAHVMNGFQQHAAGAARRIVDRLALAWVEDADHQAHHRARRVELTGFLVGEIREFLDEVLVRLAEDVRFRRRVAQRDAREMLDQVAQQRIREALLVGPLRITAMCPANPASRGSGIPRRPFSNSQHAFRGRP